MDLAQAGLVQLVWHFYPTGFPMTTDEPSRDLHP